VERGELGGPAAGYGCCLLGGLGGRAQGTTITPLPVMTSPI
jgi:hypothetical protein